VTNRPWVLAEVTWNEVRSTRYAAAVLPWSATEAHNRHLPYATDTVETEGIAHEAARLAWERGAQVVVLPCVPFGVNTGQLDIPLCINMNPSTQGAVLVDITRSLEAQGVLKLLILNGHGGNDFRQMIRELQPATKVFLATINWYRVVDPAAYFDEPGDHAGELETSVMLHLAPALVRPLSEAGRGSERKSRLRGVREGWAWAPGQWTRVSDDTGIGDPRAATAAKGERYLGAVCAKIAEFLVEFAALDPDDPYH